MLNIFVGAPQSKYAAIAILFALVAVSIAILFGRDQVPVGQKFMFIVLMFVLALPGLLLTLFQLTCLVTGAGLKNQRWWCSAYAWIGTILIMLYAIVLVIVAVMSMVNGTDIKKDLVAMDAFTNNKATANVVAKEYFQATEEKKEGGAGAQAYDMPDPMPAVKESFQTPPAETPMAPTSMGTAATAPAVAGAPAVAAAPATAPPKTPEAFSASDLEPFSSCGAPLA